MLNDDQPSKWRSKFALSVIWALLGRGIVVAAGFLVTVLLARLLPPTQIGIYYLAQSAVLMAVPLASLGLQQPAIAAIAAAKAAGDQQRAAAFARSSLRLALLASVAISGVGVLGWVSADRLGIVGYFTQQSVVLLIAAWIIVLAVEAQLVGVLQGLEKIGTAVAYDSALGKVLSLVALFALWLGPGATDVVSVLVVFVGCEFVSLIAAMANTWRAIVALGPPGPPIPLSELCTKTWPFLLQQLIGSVVLQSSVLILGLFRSPAEVAIYGMASRLAGLLGIPGTIINVPLAPSVARLHAQNRRQEIQSLMQSSTIVPTMIAAAITLGFAFYGDIILGRMFGSAYSGGRYILLILSAGQCVNLFLGPSLLGLAMTGHQRIVTWIGLVVGAVQVVVLFFAARPFGAIGTAFCTAIEPCLIKALGWVAVYRLLNIQTHFPLRAVLRILRK